MVIDRALYGLKSSGGLWHHKLAQNIRDMGFRPIPADYDFYLREVNASYEYIAVIVDDLLILSKDPQPILDTLTELYGYELKGVGIPEYYNGANIAQDPKTNLWTVSAHTYITNVVDRVKKTLNVQIRPYDAPMEAHYKAALRVLGYLSKHPKARLLFNPQQPALDGITFEKNDWIALYPVAKEYIPEIMPPPSKITPLSLTVLVDASHA